MKRFLVLLILAMPILAQAFDCWPRPVGNGTAFHVSQRDGMLGMVWWCDKVNYWKPQVLVGAMTPAQAYQVAQQLSAAPDFDQAARALYTANAGPLTEELDIFRVATYWDHAQHKPADPVFAVAPNTGVMTRPAYPVVNGVRQTRQDGTAPVGATCSRRLESIEGTTRTVVYMAFDSTNRVAVCSRR
jgi:hypothetical protein